MDMQQEAKMIPCSQLCEKQLFEGQRAPCASRCLRTGGMPEYITRIEAYSNKTSSGADAQAGIGRAVSQVGTDLGLSYDQMQVVVTHPLFAPLLSAIKQAAFGKGERHGGVSKPFLEQPWHALAEQHGVGFLTGQAAKKTGEAASGKTGGDWEREILGAVVYLGMSLIFHREP